MDQETARKREAGFLSYPGDAAAVYRFAAGEIADRSIPLERVRLSGGSPIESGFTLIATGPIMGSVDALDILNEYRANGFTKPGDIVVFKQAGALSCWSVDLLAYNRLRGLLENPLKTAELDMEQNCNQIDGIINNTAPRPDELASEDEALFLVGGTTYLHVQTSEDDRNYTREDCYTTYDYTLYDKKTMRQLDGGRMEVAADIRDAPEQVHRLAAQNILECRTVLGASPLELVSLDILEALQDAAMREMGEGTAPKPSLRDNLKQCQREAADRSHCGGPPADTALGRGGDAMKLTKIEQETIINFNEAERTASVYTHNEALKGRLLALCRTHPEQVRQTDVNRWGGLTFDLPKKWLKVSPPRVLSPAQRAVLDRMNQGRQGGKSL